MVPSDGALPPSLPRPAAFCPYCFTFPRVSYKWDRVFCNLLHPVSSTYCVVLELVVARFSLLLSGRTPLAGTRLSVFQ